MTNAIYHNGLTLCALDKVDDQRGCPEFKEASAERRCMYRVAFGKERFRCDNIDQQQAALTACRACDE